jgi:hypothetical protein
MTELEMKSYKSLFEDYKELYTEHEKLKREYEFLRERENKLQLIEQMFQNGIVDLSELSKLVKESE